MLMLVSVQKRRNSAWFCIDQGQSVEASTGPGWVAVYWRHHLGWVSQVHWEGPDKKNKGNNGNICGKAIKNRWFPWPTCFLCFHTVHGIKFLTVWQKTAFGAGAKAPGRTSEIGFLWLNVAETQGASLSYLYRWYRSIELDCINVV